MTIMDAIVIGAALTVLIRAITKLEESHAS